MIGSIVIASDHAGYILKKKLIDHLTNVGYKVKDMGTDSEKSVDYPDFAHPLANEVEKGKYKCGISICGTGNGINMTVNKHHGIRSALCWNEEIAKFARYHNNANVCALPARFIDEELAISIVDIFLNTSFEGGRHLQRINKIPYK